MAERAQHHGRAARVREVADPRMRFVDDHQRVDPDVPLRMPFGLLRAPSERVQFGKEPCDDAEIVCELQPGGWSRCEEQQLLDFPPHAFGRQIVERQASANSPRRFVHGQLEPGGELNPAQYAQAVLGERLRVHHSQESSLQQIAPASNGSMYAPVRGSQAMAFTVKSRRLADSSGAIHGSPVTSNALCPRPIFDSRRGRATSMSATL
jgi:hypothetical protein